MDHQGAEGGRLHAAIANEIVSLTARFTGRGPTKSRAFVHDDMVVCLLEHGLTRGEAKLVADRRLHRRARLEIRRGLQPAC